MPEDEHTDYGTHDRDNKSITDDENPMDFQIDDDSGDDLGTNEGDYTGSDIDENDIDDGTETGEDEELPEDSSRALSQWASKLCVVCRRFLEGTVYTEGGYSCNKSSTYHPSKSSMRQSLQAGCPLCKKLSCSLDNYWVVPDDSWFIKCSVDRTEDDLIYGESERIVLHFYLFDDEGFQVDADNSPGFEYMTFHLAKSLGTCLGPAFFECNPTASTAKSVASFDMIRAWYHGCTCRKWRPESRVLPTRLVQVWRPRQQGFPDTCARLCDTGNLLVESTSYVTLSHRWGPDTFLKLQKSNQRVFQEGIPVDQLLNVFKDALYIAAELNIHFIWIDSLCIIQDCQEDWTRESKRMGEVYQYGECNTAATGYDHGNQSLFGTRDAIPFQQFPVYIDCYFRGNPGQHFKGFYVKVNERGFRDAVINGPLDSRGWVAQEWALSPAVLHYTPEEIWWDCDDRIACETLPSGAENWDPLELCTNRRIRSLIDGNKEPSYRFWRSFIQLYAHTETTFEKDRFPAVAGIARILGNMLHEGFIAGIWEGDIVRSLVWECRDELSIPSTHLAPSWSWACVCGRISGWGFETNSLAHQLGCVSIQVLSDIDGFTSDLEATSLEKSNVRALAIQGPLRKLPHDLSVEIGEGINGVRYVDVIEDRYRMNLGLQDGSIPDEQAWRLEGSTHLLPLAKDEESVYGLLIQHVPEAPDPNTFRRSGKVHFYFDTIEVAEEYLGISQKDGEYQPSWRFRECGVQDVVLI